MTSIGILSDTHNFLDEKIMFFFKDVDEIWHAGDIGAVQVADKIQNQKPLKAVYGNIDGNDVRNIYPGHLRFKCEEKDVWITHIGGYPGNYDYRIRDKINQAPPDIFICGHSHILKIMHDKKLGLLHINPGAAGKSGLHQVRTAVRFCIDGKRIYSLEVYEIKR